MFALIHSAERPPAVVSDGLWEVVETCDYLHYKLPINTNAVMLADTLIVDETASPIRAILPTIVKNERRFVISLTVLRKDGVIECDFIDPARWCKTPVDLNQRIELDLYSEVMLRAYTLFRYTVDAYARIATMSDKQLADTLLTSVAFTEINGVRALQLMRLNEQSTIPLESQWYNRCITGYFWDSGIDNYPAVKTFAEVIGCVENNDNPDELQINMDMVPDEWSGTAYSVAASSSLLKCPLAFEYTDEVGNKLQDKYLNMLSTPECSQLIKDYLPGTTMLIHNSSTGVTTLLLVLKDKDGGDTMSVSQLGITTSISVGDERVWGYLRGHRETAEELFNQLWDVYGMPEDWINELCDLALNGTATAICALLHICNVRRVTALRREQRKNENGEVQIQNGPKSKVEAESSKKEEPRVYGTPIRLFSLTPRTFVRKKVAHVEHARGWTMPIHTRAAHYRHVWVGSGENKHKELRMIQSVVVNKDKQQLPRVRELQL